MIAESDMVPSLTPEIPDTPPCFGHAITPVALGKSKGSRASTPFSSSPVTSAHRNSPLITHSPIAIRSPYKASWTNLWEESGKSPLSLRLPTSPSRSPMGLRRPVQDEDPLVPTPFLVGTDDCELTSQLVPFDMIATESDISKPDDKGLYLFNSETGDIWSYHADRRDIEAIAVSGSITSAHVHHLHFALVHRKDMELADKIVAILCRDRSKDIGAILFKEYLIGAMYYYMQVSELPFLAAVFPPSTIQQNELVLSGITVTHWSDTVPSTNSTGLLNLINLLMENTALLDEPSPCFSLLSSALQMSVKSTFDESWRHTFENLSQSTEVFLTALMGTENPTTSDPAAWLWRALEIQHKCSLELLELILRPRGWDSNGPTSAPLFDFGVDEDHFNQVTRNESPIMQSHSPEHLPYATAPQSLPRHPSSNTLPSPPSPSQLNISVPKEDEYSEAAQSYHTADNSGMVNPLVSPPVGSPRKNLTAMFDMVNPRPAEIIESGPVKLAIPNGSSEVLSLLQDLTITQEDLFFDILPQTQDLVTFLLFLTMPRPMFSLALERGIVQVSPRVCVHSVVRLSVYDVNDRNIIANILATLSPSEAMNFLGTYGPFPLLDQTLASLFSPPCASSVQGSYQALVDSFPDDFPIPVAIWHKAVQSMVHEAGPDGLEDLHSATLSHVTTRAIPNYHNIEV